jgi:hypothetical protein
VNETGIFLRRPVIAANVERDRKQSYPVRERGAREQHADDERARKTSDDDAGNEPK